MSAEVLGPANPRIAELRRHIRRRSSRSDDIVLEGPRTVAEALDAGLELRTVVVPESGQDDAAVVEIRGRVGPETEWLAVRDKAFTRLASSVTPQPMLALAARPASTLPAAMGPGDIALVLVGVSDPGNVGTLIRVADAMGVVCVAVCGGADPWGDKAVRASSGSVMRVPVVSGVHAAPALDRLRGAGARIVGTSVDDGEPHDSGVLAPPVAIVLGSEAHGLDPEVHSAVDAWATIAMPGNAESLNVAMAGTLLAYQASRSASPG